MKKFIASSRTEMNLASFLMYTTSIYSGITETEKDILHKGLSFGVIMKVRPNGLESPVSPDMTEFEDGVCYRIDPNCEFELMTGYEWAKDKGYTVCPIRKSVSDMYLIDYPNNEISRSKSLGLSYRCSGWDFKGFLFNKCMSKDDIQDIPTKRVYQEDGSYILLSATDTLWSKNNDHR